MILKNFIRGIVHKHPELRIKLKRASSKQTPFQYVYMAIVMTVLSIVGLGIIFIFIFSDNILVLGGVILLLVLVIPVVYKFWFNIVDVQIRKKGREIDGDLLFISEYFLVSLESGLPLGNAIERISKLDRPGGVFFKKVFTEFQTGKDLEEALDEGEKFCPNESLKVLLKRLKDSLVIGIDLGKILENFIDESSEKKIIEVRGYAKKLNPIVTIYLLLGIVIPSLGVTFFILGSAFLSLTPDLLRVILFGIFLVMFLFQYIAYTGFKFSRSTL